MIKRKNSNLNEKEKAKMIFLALKNLYPNAKCALIYKNPFELLIATILSAQCTDTQVNKVTRELFKKYPTPSAMAKAKAQDIERLIYSTGFFKNKARNILSCSSILVENFDNKVPSTMKELLTLKGVGRKTANVVLANAFQITSGIVVDTHVMRLSRLLKLSKSSTPEKIESDLKKLFPESSWILLSHLLIFHGRAVCLARRPKCQVCSLAQSHLCESLKKNKNGE